jgi:hypothetical protein
MGNSPAPSSPPEERGGQAVSGKMASGKQRSGGGYLPLSDSNVTTTHQDAGNWHNGNDDINVRYFLRCH